MARVSKNSPYIADPEAGDQGVEDQLLLAGQGSGINARKEKLRAISQEGNE